MNHDYLNIFCDKSSEPHAVPFSDDKYTYASDGHIIVKVPLVNGVGPNKKSPNATSLKWEITHKGEWLDLPTYSLPQKQICILCIGGGKVDVCPECDGDGEVCFSNQHSHYEEECKTCCGNAYILGEEDVCSWCKGEGRTYPSNIQGTIMNDTKMNIYLLEKIKTLDNPKIFLPDFDGMVHFKFDGGVGILMVMKW